jgi:hypothetical protein
LHLPYARLRDIRKAIDKGCPVLVSFSNDEHWAVVYGYSRRSVFVADPSITKNLRCRLSKARFVRQWDRWMMAVGERIGWLSNRWAIPTSFQPSCPVVDIGGKPQYISYAYDGSPAIESLLWTLFQLLR